MERMRILLLVMVTYILLAHGCQTVPPTTPTDSSNLLANTSFELEGSSSLEPWVPSPSDTSLVYFSTDVPPYGGAYSAALETVLGPTVSVSSSVAAPRGTYRYRLSAWAKGSRAGGTVQLCTERSNTLTVRKSVAVIDTSWMPYFLEETVTTDAGERIVVRLRGGYSQFFSGATLFDLCRLEREAQ